MQCHKIGSGKFYLVDSGYPNRPGYLALYKGTKYHLPEYRYGPLPRGMKETFNYAHSSLRNVVERAFAVLKEKWRILYNVPKYPMPKQSQIIIACIALHNFIRESDIEDEDFRRFDMDEEYLPEGHEAHYVAEENQEQGTMAEDVNMNAFRDAIAHALFHKSR